MNLVMEITEPIVVSWYDNQDTHCTSKSEHGWVMVKGKGITDSQLMICGGDDVNIKIIDSLSIA